MVLVNCSLNSVNALVIDTLGKLILNLKVRTRKVGITTIIVFITIRTILVIILLENKK